MNNKVILVILDGLNYQVAADCLGYLMGHVEQRSARLFKLRCELTSLSNQTSVLSLARKAGKKNDSCICVA